MTAKSGAIETTGPQNFPSPSRPAKPKKRIDKTKILFISVIVAAISGITLGLVAPEFAQSLKPLGTIFIELVKMMIVPVIFCTLVLGVGSVAKAATVGKIGGLAMIYFVIMSTFALFIGLLVGNIIQPGQGLHLTPDSSASVAPQEATSTTDFVIGIIPDTLISSLTSGNILQTLLVALLVGFALQGMGKSGEPILNGFKHLQKLVFRVLAMVMWVSPIGAFGALAAMVGATGFQALVSLASVMLGFYITCALFIVVVLGLMLKIFAGANIFSLLKYLVREFILIVATSSSETALPRLIAKMEHLGVSKPTVGIVVPTGYSFNLDGTAIYLTMSAIFIADAMDSPLNFGEQLSLLVFMIIASKGAAGVSGAGLATLAAGLQAHRPDLLDGVGIIVGIDRFMSEARALTNFTGNAVATILIGTWTKQIDKEQMAAVLSGKRPFDEAVLETLEDHNGPGQSADASEIKSPIGPKENSPL